MSRLQQYQLVRVRKLLKKPEEYGGMGFDMKQPAVGDIGTLIDIWYTPGVPKGYEVEASGKDGITIWLCTLCEDELEPVTGQM
jgi:hypothetical protein